MTTQTRPFDDSGVARGADGILRYQNRLPSLVESLRHSVDQFPDQEAVVELGGARLTYRQLWDRSARVAIRYGNGVDWCLAFFGIQLLGAIAVPVNTRFSEGEVEYVIHDSSSRYVFLPHQPLPDGPPFVVDDLTEDELSAIFYTSGTTGFPKGAMTSHQNFLANVENCQRVTAGRLDSSMRTLVSVPLFHVTGCNSQLLPASSVGGTTVIMPHFDVQSFLSAIEKERITAASSVPAIFWLAIHQKNFSEFDVSRITRLSYGGAPMAPELVLKIMDAFPNARVGNGFGLTETSSLSTYLPHEYSRLRPETVGFAVPSVDVRLAEHAGDVGELLVRGQNVVRGYWNKPEATAETFKDGWLHTGDLARIDGEGYVQIVDRKKDMVNRGGENVYCVEVENGLAGHPAVFEVAVMGVPDEVMGEKVGAVVVPKPGQTVVVDELLEYAGSVLADFKVPHYVVIRQELLPRNPGGKILKKALRESVKWGAQYRLRHRAE